MDANDTGNRHDRAATRLREAAERAQFRADKARALASPIGGKLRRLTGTISTLTYLRSKYGDDATLDHVISMLVADARAMISGESSP